MTPRSRAADTNPRVGLFPGQGLPAKVVLGALSEGEQLLGVANEVLGFDLRRKVEVATRREGATLSTSLAQPAIFVASAIAFARADDDSHGYLAGHSLGEYSALFAAGVFGFEDALRAVAARGEAMQAASRSSPGGMTAVLGLDDEAISRITEETGVEIANDNAPGQVVLSGSEEGLAEAATQVRAANGRAVLLEVSAPFHSRAMVSAEPALKDALEDLQLSEPEVPVVCNVPARPYESLEEIRA
ncbi:MAG: ACP S-malonyltransferase, partial [Actinomycetota bacterium]